MTDTQLYYILCLERSDAVGGPVWWCADRMGYTADLENAGQYSAAVAVGICDSANVVVLSEVAIPVTPGTQAAALNYLLKRRLRELELNEH